MTDSINGKPVSDYTLAELWAFLEETLRHLDARRRQHDGLQAVYQRRGTELALIECVAHEVFLRARRTALGLT